MVLRASRYVRPWKVVLHSVGWGGWQTATVLINQSINPLIKALMRCADADAPKYAIGRV